MKFKPLTVAIKNPCHEEWEDMSPTEKGRFCSSCSKRVVDFTHMHVDEIIKTIQQANMTICGRIDEQRISAQLFLKYNQPRKSYFKTIAASVLFLLS